MHMLRYSSVDTTMRLADEFDERQRFLKIISDNESEETKEAASAIAFVADEQTAGRGQRENTWKSPKSNNLYVTYLMRVKNMPLTAPQVAALSVAETCNSYLKNCDKKVGLKWINDVFYGDKKIAGMLCQSSV